MFADIIREFAARGHYSFRYQEMEKRLASSPVAIKAALRRMQKKGEIAMPYRGFYVIVPPEYQSIGCLPAQQFIPELMDYLRESYYAGLLTAAQYHGAAHQRSQVFQVVVSKARRPLHCGKVRVDFFVRKNAQKIPAQTMNTPAGFIKISTAESTALDLIGYINNCGGINNVATVLKELAEKIDEKKLMDAARLSPLAWAQRLGYVLDVSGISDKSECLAEYIADKRPVRIPLVPALSIKGAKLDARWRVFINTEVEVEI